MASDQVEETQARRLAKVAIFRLRNLSRIKGLVHGFSTRQRTQTGGDEFNMSFKTSNCTEDVVANRRAFCEALRIPLESVIFMQQSHGNNVAVVTKADSGQGAMSPQSAIPNTDAMITQEKGVFLAAMGADCALVLLYDPAAGAVGIVHAGWRGTVLGIVEQGVRKMRREFGCDPAKIIAGIGPSIGPCCYEVGNDVKEAALAGRGIEEVSPRAGKLFFDLRKANVDQLLAQGVPRGNIEVADICTSCAHDRFFSYRRDGPTGGRACGIVGWMK